MSFAKKPMMRSRNYSPFDAVIGRMVAPSCVDMAPTERTHALEPAPLIDAQAVNPHNSGAIRRPVFLAFKEPAVS